MVGLKPLGAPEVDRDPPAGEDHRRHSSALGAPEVDRRLRKALDELHRAERNAVLWFGQVVRRRLYRDLGFSSIYLYAEQALGFSRPRTAQFIRLSEALEELPVLKRSVAAGDVPWTKAREVAKVATPRTESAWVEVARTESRRRIERRVRMAQTRSRARRRVGGRQLGLGDATDHPVAPPADRPCPQKEHHGGEVGPKELPCDLVEVEVPVTLSLRFTPEQYARYEAMFEKLRKNGERGAREELILAGLELLLGESGTEPARPRRASAAALPSAPGGKGGGASGDGAISPRNPKPAGRLPVYQIVVQQCEDCGRARVQTSRGARPVGAAAAEAMRCDARVLRLGERNRPGEFGGGTSRSGKRRQPGDGINGTNRADEKGKRANGPGDNHLPDDGSPDGPPGRFAPRNRATIPPAVRREVMARDGHRCRAPGCGSARFLEVHHVRPRSEGGSNRPDNLVTLCSACHRLAHGHPHPG